MRVLIVSEGEHELGGALPTLVKRVIGRDFTHEVKTVRDPEFRATHGKGAGHFKKAVRCLIYAAGRGFDAIVFVIDQDDEVDRRRQISQAQDYQGVGIHRALGVAIRTFDAWMLADEVALSGVLEYPVQQQADPEAEPDPKSICTRLLESSNQQLAQSAMYAALAQKLRLEILERRCCDGFGVFAQRLRTL